MKTFIYKISTKLKEEIKDPKGEVVEQISNRLAIANDIKVCVGKFYEIKILASDKKEADEKIKTLALEVLTNPIVETYTIEAIKED